LGDLLAEARGLCQDDYESPETILPELSDRMGRPVSITEARTALVLLSDRGDLRAYVFDAARQVYEPASAAHVVAGAELWFLAP
jgi:hypothetical protein